VGYRIIRCFVRHSSTDRRCQQLSVLKEDEVNIIVHGHEPTLSEMIVEAARDPELLELARSKGAKKNKHLRNVLHRQ